MSAIRRLPVKALGALFRIIWRDFRFVELMWGCQTGAATSHILAKIDRRWCGYGRHVPL